VIFEQEKSLDEKYNIHAALVIAQNMYPKDPLDFGGDVFSDILSENVALMPLNSKSISRIPNMFFKRLHD
jgi:hypothetical protein